MPHRIRASVRFLSTAFVHGASPTQSMDLGVAYDVTLELPFWTEVAHLFRPDDACELTEGSHLVARGTWS